MGLGPMNNGPRGSGDSVKYVEGFRLATFLARKYHGSAPAILTSGEYDFQTK